MKQGFTVIELLVVIAIIAILTLIAIPTFQRQQRVADFDAFVEDVFDSIAEARISALSNKACANSSPSVEWTLDLSITNQTYEVLCDGASLESPDIPPSVSTNLYAWSGDDFTQTPATISDTLSFSFETGGNSFAVMDGGTTLYRKGKILFTLSEYDEERVVCFDTLAGYPTMDRANQCPEN